MGLPNAATRFDLESYLAWEAEQPEKHEYHRGEVFAMVGARLPHQTVVLNISAALREYLLVDPDARRVERFRRNADDRWVLHDFTAAAECTLTSVGAVLPLATIVEDLDAPDQPPPSPPTDSTAES